MVLNQTTMLVRINERTVGQ